MIFYLLYRLGFLAANTLSVRDSYRIARMLADGYSALTRDERDAIVSNLKVILGGAAPSDKELEWMAREVFRNFAKYLVDFFRFDKVDRDFMERRVRVEGRDNVNQALEKGKGVILLSAHVGNWELGGFVVARLGYPVSAVVLPHQNKMINDFFTRQRSLSSLIPIETGVSLRACYSVLKNNRLLALLGDRDFSKNGRYIDFFGRKALIPTGPAALSHRLGAAIVPCFIVWDKDEMYRFWFEEPIFPDQPSQSSLTREGEDAAIEGLMKRYIPSIEACIRRYPTQWYIFKRVWGSDDILHPDTII
jgi:KDO2-lipid IV(A) lauroyltransferase